MERQKRESFVAKSFFILCAFIFLSSLTFIGGAAYLILYREYINVIDIAIRIACIQTVFCSATYISWRLYRVDSKLLSSGSSDYMSKNSINVNINHIDCIDSGEG